jgi:hypothetical protein
VISVFFFPIVNAIGTFSKQGVRYMKINSDSLV